MVNIQENRGREWLKSAGVRPTRQRLTLAELLIGDGLNRHVCAESLHETVCSNSLNVSLATIYNTLRTFCDAGLMHEIHVDWESSGKLTDAPKESIRFEKLPDVPQGYNVSRVDVVIRLKDL